MPMFATIKEADRQYKAAFFHNGCFARLLYSAGIRRRVFV